MEGFINTFKNSLSDDRINWPSGIFPNITCYEALVSKSAWPPVWWESHFSLLEFPQVCSQLCDSFQLFIQKTLNRPHHCGKSIGLWHSALWKCLGGLFFFDLAFKISLQYTLSMTTGRGCSFCENFTDIIGIIFQLKCNYYSLHW